MTGSAGQLRVPASYMQQIPIPLPPLPEQHRIVTKLEELLTKLDAGTSTLQKTQAQLKRYRQSVLKAACEGKLVPTEAELAKAEGRDYEPADVLLARILKERRERSSKGEKYKEPAAPDTNGLPELLEGWAWANIGQITVLFIRSQNVKMMSLDLSDVVYVSQELHEQISRTHVQFGDVLLNITGASIGRVAWYNFQDISANVNVEQSLAQAQRLRQSILKKAFEGRLVAQDPGDEPAGVLVERIKAEKARMGNKKIKTRKA